jgi:hypothetical protein
MEYASNLQIDVSFYLFLVVSIDLEFEGYCENRGCTDELS